MSNRLNADLSAGLCEIASMFDRMGQAMPTDVRFDCQLIDSLVQQCQVLIGRIPMIGAPAISGQLRALVEKTPRPRTVVGEAFVEHLILQLALRLSPGLTHLRDAAGHDHGARGDSRRESWRAADLMKVLMNVAPPSGHASGEATPFRELRTDGHRAVEKAVAFIARHFTDARLRLGQVAAHVHLSSSHLDRLLVKHSGIGFGGHVRRHRIEHAMRLLVHSDLSIKEIAAAVGYDRASTFDRNFKQACACSPGEWRAWSQRQSPQPDAVASRRDPGASRIDHEKQD
jgi:AraC-like DNA-binding protein